MGHVERNDSLKRRYGVAVRRYDFAIKCLISRKVPASVIDLGCGMGYGCHLMRKAGFDVMGIDNSQEAIDYAKETYPGNYEVRDLEKMDKEFSKNYQVAVCLEVLCHLKDPQKFIDNLDVKDLIISAPIDPNQNDGYPWRLHNLSEEQFKGMLKDWKIIDEVLEKRYLTIYAIKI